MKVGSVFTSIIHVITIFLPIAINIDNKQKNMNLEYQDITSVHTGSNRLVTPGVDGPSVTKCSP